MQSESDNDDVYEMEAECDISEEIGDVKNIGKNKYQEVPIMGDNKHGKVYF